jgi:hypothetical protein
MTLQDAQFIALATIAAAGVLSITALILVAVSAARAPKKPAPVKPRPRPRRRYIYTEDYSKFLARCNDLGESPGQHYWLLGDHHTALLGLRNPEVECLDSEVSPEVLDTVLRYGGKVVYL